MAVVLAFALFVCVIYSVTDCQCAFPPTSQSALKPAVPPASPLSSPSTVSPSSRSALTSATQATSPPAPFPSLLPVPTTPSAEVECVMNLLFRYLAPDADGERIFSWLHIIVRGAAWVDDDFLRGLPPDVVRLVYDDPTDFSSVLITYEEYFYLPPCLVLVTTDEISKLDTVPIRGLPFYKNGRVVVWASTNASVDDDILELTPSAVLWILSYFNEAQSFVRLAVTQTLEDRTWVFGLLAPTSEVSLQQNLTAFSLDSWTRDGGWQSGYSLLEEPCTTAARKTDTTRPLLGLYLNFPGNQKHQNEIDAVLYAMESYIGQRIGLTEIAPLDPLSVYLVRRSRGMCYYDLEVLPLAAYEVSGQAVFPWEQDDAIFVVPSGLGRGRGPLYRLVGAFSVETWCAISVTTVAVAFTMWCCSRTAGLKTAAVSTLAPLLTQGSSSALTGRQKVVFGMWLLTSLVLAAAYQGMIHGMLIAPDPRAEMNTLEELSESNLTIWFSGEMASALYIKEEVSIGLADKMQVASDWDHFIDLRASIAEHRNASLMVGSAWLSFFAEDPEVRRGKLHFFESPTGSMLKAGVLTFSDSPLATPLRKAYGRLRAAGLIGRRETWPPVGDSEPQPLTLENVSAAFLVAAVGLVAATVAWAAEWCVFWRDRKRTKTGTRVIALVELRPVPGQSQCTTSLPGRRNSSTSRTRRTATDGLQFTQASASRPSGFYLHGYVKSRRLGARQRRQLCLRDNVIVRRQKPIELLRFHLPDVVAQGRLTPSGSRRGADVYYRTSRETQPLPFIL